MVAAGVVDIAVNPNNTAQRYIMWSNGRVDAIGGAVPITSGPQWFDRTDQPVGVAITITNWTTGQGYILDWQGGFQSLNGAPDMMTVPYGDVPKAVPNIPYIFERGYVDWSWDPAGTGQGYVMDAFGRLREFGGATPCPRTGARWSVPVARKLEMQWGATKKALTLDYTGGLHPDFGAAGASGGPYWPGQDVARDFFVTDWINMRGYVLDRFGAAQPFGGAASSAFGGPYYPGSDRARKLYVLSASNPLRFWQVHSAGQAYEYVASGPPTVTAGAGSTEVQSVAISGTPTGGTFTLSYNGQTTAAIAYSATASTVQTALRALSGIGSTGVNVTGGPGPGTAWTITFAGALANTNVPMITATSSLTGGTSPSITIALVTGGITASPANTTTTTTQPTLAWAYSDPDKDLQARYQVYLFTQAFVTANSGVATNPAAYASSALYTADGTEPNTRGVVPTVDLANGAYQFYVRVQDTAGQWSSWASRSWTQNVPVPATPTGLTATVDNTTLSVALSVSATTGGSADAVRFDYSDNGGTTWAPVVGAESVPIASTTTARDSAPPMGVTRTYRAVAFNDAPRTASVPSVTATATLTKLTYALTSTANPALGGEVGVQAPVEWTRPVVVGQFRGIGSTFVTVVSDGAPKGRETTLHVITETRAAWNMVEALVMSDSTLVYRDPFGGVMYCRLAGDWTRQQLLAAPLMGEATPMRHAHTTDLKLVEVAPPMPVA